MLHVILSRKKCTYKKWHWCTYRWFFDR